MTIEDWLRAGVRREAQLATQDTTLETNGPVDVSDYVSCLEVKRVSFRKNSNGLYKCPEVSCGHTSKFQTNIKHHYQKHTGERPFQCKLCGKKFSRKINCLDHVRTHTDSFKHKCPRCEAKFPRKFELKKHINRFH